MVALRQAGFTGREVAAYLLVGLPGQTPTDIVESIRFVHRCGVQVRLSEYTPIPATSEGDLSGPMGGFVQDEEPLLHNNSFYSASSLPDPWVTIEQIKQQARVGNRRILKGLAP